MSIYRFIYEQLSFSFKLLINNGVAPTQKVDLGLNIEGVLNLLKAKKRTIHDVMKDADEDPSVSNIEDHLTETFFPDTKSFGNNYKKGLHDIENDSVFMGDEEVYFDVIKTSTDRGPPIQFRSSATNILYESGMGPEKICTTPIQQLNIWDTPAAHLDPASKIQGNKYFPDNKNTIIFDKSFTTKLGFPHNLEWTTTDVSETADGSKQEVTISASQYINTTPLKVKIDLNKNTFTPTVNSKGLAYFSLLGNKRKNTALNKLTNTKAAAADIFKCLLLKELGDVAQVWLYFALIILNLFLTGNYAGQINNYLMLTTDSVVYFFCKVMRLPSEYSGSRTGVQRGRCTVKYFTIGTPDYKKHLRNLLLIESKRILQHNLNNSTAIEKILKVDIRQKKAGLINFSLFNIHIKIPNYVQHNLKKNDYICSGIELINGRVVSGSLTDAYVKTRVLTLKEQLDISNIIKQRLEGLLQKIEQLNIDLEAFVKSQNAYIETKDFTQVSANDITPIYYRLLDELKRYKCEQYITILKKSENGAKYTFNKIKEIQHDSITFFNRHITNKVPFTFLDDVIPDFPDSSVEDEDSFDEEDEEDEEIDESKDPEEPDGKRQRIKGGSRLPVGRGQFNQISSIKKENIYIGYYEYLLLYFVYTFWFQNFKIVDSIVPLTTYSEYCLFAKYYDMLVWECSNNNWNLDTWNHPQFSKHFKKIFKKKTDEEIEMLGKQLSNYINFYNWEETTIESMTSKVSTIYNGVQSRRKLSRINNRQKYKSNKLSKRSKVCKTFNKCKTLKSFKEGKCCNNSINDIKSIINTSNFSRKFKKKS